MRLLLALSVFVGVSRLINSTASSTLFLVNFNASVLPYIYVLMAIVVPLIGWINTRLERRVSFVRLLFFNMVGYWLVLAGLRLAMSFTTASWPVFLYSLWSEVGWIIMNLTLWGLAGRLLTVREAKRLFGIIGAAGGLAAIVAGFFIPTLILWVGTLNLLFVVLITLGAAIGLLIYASRAFSGQLAATVTEEETVSNVRWKIPRRYVNLLILMAMLAEAAFYFVDIIFFKQVQIQFSTQAIATRTPLAEVRADKLQTVSASAEAALASFMGKYLATMNLLALLGNLFLVAPLINRFGIRGGLLILPLATGIIAIIFAVFGLLLLPSTFLFSAAVLNSVLDWVLRDTVFRSAVLILYQPLPPSQRSRIQTRVESIAMPIAQGVTGLLLLGLGLLSFTPLQVNWVLLMLVVSCMVLAVILARAYSPVLIEALARRVLKLNAQSLLLNDPTSRAVLLRELHSPYPEAVMYALNTLEAMEFPLQNEYRSLLEHPGQAVRREALVRIERLRAESYIDPVKKLLDGEKDPAVRAAGFRTLAALSGEQMLTDMEANLESTDPTLFTAAMVRLMKQHKRREDLEGRLGALLASSNPQDRESGLQIASELGETLDWVPRVVDAFQDEDMGVRRAALWAAVELDQPQLWDALFSALDDRSLRSEAMAALMSTKEKALPLIRTYLLDRTLTRNAQIACLRILGLLHSRDSIPDLLAYVEYTDVEIREHALVALNRCGYRFDSRNLMRFKQALMTEIADAAGTLSLQIQLKRLGSPMLLHDALEVAWARHQERVILILRMQFDPALILRVRDNLALGSREKRAYAIEVLDQLLADEYKLLLIPMFDEIPLERRLESWTRSFPALQDAVYPDVGALLDLPADFTAESRTPWMKACIIQAVGQEASLQSKLAGLDDRHPLVKDALAWALRPAAKGKEKTMLSIIERVLILKTVSIFGDTPDYLLAEVADLLQEEDLPADQTFITKGDPATCMYVIVKGEVRAHDAERTFNVVGPREIVGELAILDPGLRTASVTTTGPTHLLKLDQAPLFELMNDRPEVALGIIKVLAGRLRQTLAAVGK